MFAHAAVDCAGDCVDVAFQIAGTRLESAGKEVNFAVILVSHISVGELERAYIYAVVENSNFFL